jgi:hypothetical protein
MTTATITIATTKPERYRALLFTVDGDFVGEDDGPVVGEGEGDKVGLGEGDALGVGV